MVSAKNGDEQGYSVEFLKDVMKTIRSNYVKEVSESMLVEYAINGMVRSLDPHCDFFNKEHFQEVKISTEGEFNGIGVVMGMDRNMGKVLYVHEDGPAYHSGIKAGDYITTINGTPTKSITKATLLNQLKSNSLKSVHITVYRERTRQTLQFNITPRKIVIKPVKHRMLGDDVGYIKISSFNKKSFDMTQQALKTLLNPEAKRSTESIPPTKMNYSMKGIILDLRSNSGGLLEQATDIADLFLKSGDIVKVEGNNSSKRKVIKATDVDITNGLPLVVLINKETASAAEILAGALQDNKRGLVIGEKSFGKGSVQSIIQLNNDTAIKLTTDMYYTPSGRSIQATGIVPDIHVSPATIQPIEQKSSQISSEADLIGHLPSRQALPEKDTTGSTDQGAYISTDIDKYQNDFQLLRAVDLVKGMALYQSKMEPTA